MTDLARLRLEIRGAVQGVGFRPFVFRLARELELGGWVRNDARGVELEVEGPRAAVEAFAERLQREKPRPSIVQSIERRWLSPRGEEEFRIEASGATTSKSAVVLPDLATCDACRREFEEPADRRFGYPFTNCTHCGPRFTIVTGLPYDRPLTTMRGFAMCADCRAEYEAPADRRFHAQPNACPRCGPQLRLLATDGRPLAGREAALVAAAAAIGRGAILALKGLGGYQLLCDARDEAAVARLRERKRRPAKPLAVMARHLAAAAALVEIDRRAAELLASPQAPIVLLPKRVARRLAPGIAPGNPHLGVMLPTSPLHHLLLAALDFPVVATSGNLSDEPIAIDDEEALARLAGIADLFLAHDRPIARHVDDSVAWLVEGEPQLLRRARGYAPLPLLAAETLPTLLAVGAHQKAAVALSLGRQVFLSQHLGDMETPEATAAFERVIADFLRLYEAEPVALACDLHPDYPTRRWAERAARGEEAIGGLRPPLPLVAVQHHHAHLAAALCEHQIAAPALGLTWDGTGYGADGTVWGGEALVGESASFRRLARLRPLRLPGGERAVREPWRVALSLLWQLEGGAALRRELPGLASLSAAERAVVERMLEGGVASPWTSSLGRLFDGVAALVGLGARVSFEGEAAMALEFACGDESASGYELPLAAAAEPEGLAPGQRPSERFFELDWRPLVAGVLTDLARGEAVARIAARFHRALADAALALARLADCEAVALSGGCFQNRRLTSLVAAELAGAGFRPLIHRQVPPNDGGIALGQIAVAAARLARSG